MKAFLFFLILMGFVQAKTPWQITHLYDSTAKSFYIPHELWFKIPWQGKKTPPSPILKDQTIEGPFTWYHPYLKQQFNVYKKTSNYTTELFVIYSHGIAKVYDGQTETFYKNNVIFPSGKGWKINEPKTFTQEEWSQGKHKISYLELRIKVLKFEKDVLNYIKYDVLRNQKFEHTYIYDRP